jgi:hypothetical protein
MVRLHPTRHRKSPVVRSIVAALLSVTLLGIVSGLLGGVRPALASGGDSALYVHTTNDANTFGDYTLLENPTINNNPNALVFVTANWNPGGTSTNFDNHQTGVWYDSSQGKWAIFNEDQAPMPIGASFNVFTPFQYLVWLYHSDQ